MGQTQSTTTTTVAASTVCSTLYGGAPVATIPTYAATEIVATDYFASNSIDATSTYYLVPTCTATTLYTVTSGKTTTTTTKYKKTVKKTIKVTGTETVYIYPTTSCPTGGPGVIDKRLLPEPTDNQGADGTGILASSTFVPTGMLTTASPITLTPAGTSSYTIPTASFLTSSSPSLYPTAVACTVDDVEDDTIIYIYPAVGECKSTVTLKQPVSVASKTYTKKINGPVLTVYSYVSQHTTTVTGPALCPVS